MKAVATAKMVRTSPRKVNLVASLVRAQKVTDARVILANTNKGATVVVGKVLDSAVANAENNLNLTANDLVVESVFVGQGPTLKRIRPRARGQASRINKRTSHITVIVSDQKPLETKPASKAEPIKAEAPKTEVKPAQNKTEGKPANKPTAKPVPSKVEGKAAKTESSTDAQATKEKK